MDRRALILAVMALGGTATEALAAKKLTESAAREGLRELLKAGTDAAVTRVGRTDGYWGDDLIRIALPKPLAKLQKTLKAVGMSALLDDVHLRMNRAAESAAPVARGLFIDAIAGMSIKDAVGIVRGGSTSGTDYLERTTTPRLTEAFTPPMRNALQATGAVEYLDRAIRRNNLQGVIKTDARTYLAGHAVGLALDGLFHYAGVEETAIRRSPAKRTSALLKSLFG